MNEKEQLIEAIMANVEAIDVCISETESAAAALRVLLKHTGEDALPTIAGMMNEALICFHNIQLIP